MKTSQILKKRDVAFRIGQVYIKLPQMGRPIRPDEGCQIESQHTLFRTSQPCDYKNSRLMASGCVVDVSARPCNAEAARR